MDDEENEQESNKKNKQVKSIKRKIITTIMPPLLGILVVILIASAVFAVLSSVVDKMQELGKNIASFFTGNKNGNDITDEQIDSLIEQIESTGVDYDDLGLLGDVDYSAEDVQEKMQEEKRKYTKMFLEAQIVTQELHEVNKNGQVYLRRMYSDGSDKPLKYKSYEDFRKLIEENKSKVLEYFTINANGEVVIAEEEITVTQTTREETTDGEKPKYHETGKSETTTYTEKAVDYKQLISQYSTPMSFFVELGMVTRNPEFLEAVTDLVKKESKIELTFLDNTTVEETVQVDSCVEHKTERYYAENVPTPSTSRTTGDTTEEQTTVDENTQEESKRVIQEVTSHTTVKTTTTTKKTTTISNLKVTHAKTWICESTVTYNKLPSVVQDSPEEEIESSYKPEEPRTWTDGSERDIITWITDTKSTLKQTITTDVYDNGTNSGYEDKTDQFIDLLDKPYKIPNSEEPRSAGTYLKSDADMFFALLRQSSETQGMEQVMRYIMYKYTGNDYGVTSLDFTIFEPGSFSDYGGGIIGNTLEDKLWFSLRNRGYSEFAVAGLMGNLKYESGGFNPSAIEEGTREGIGLAQWSHDRKRQLINYAISKGKQWQDENIQIEFLIGELTRGGGADGYATYQFMEKNGYNEERWKNASSASEAAEAFCYSFERPASPESSLPTRKQYAEEYYQKYQGQVMYEGAVDYFKYDGHTFPHYKQGNYADHRYGAPGKTIKSSGCGPTSLAMILAGLLDNPAITPVQVVEAVDAYYGGDWTKYYLPEKGTIWGGLLNNDFLGKTYGVRATPVGTNDGINQVSSGKYAMGGVSGHVIAIIPPPEQYQNKGYKFFIMDSARRLTGPYRSAEHARSQPDSRGVFTVNYIIEKIQ